MSVTPDVVQESLTLDGLDEIIRDFYRSLCPNGHDWVWLAGWVHCRRCRTTQKSIFQPTEIKEQTK